MHVGNEPCGKRQMESCVELVLLKSRFTFGFFHRAKPVTEAKVEVHGGLHAEKDIKTLQKGEKHYGKTTIYFRIRNRRPSG